MKLACSIVAACALVAGCGSKSGDGGGSGAGKDRAKVAVSIFPLYDLTRRIAGDRLDVVLVLPPGKTEHAYDPTPKEMARLQGAKLGVSVGLDMDTWAEPVMQGAKIVHAGDWVKTMPITVEPIGEAEAHGSGSADADDKPGAPDPHVWMDPDRMAVVATKLEAELAKLDPGGKDVFKRNSAELQAKLAALDTAIKQRSAKWTKHTIVTFHGSMSYYAKRYGVTIAAVVEPLAGKEPTPSYIAEVLAAIKLGKASGLFTEPQFDRTPGETIAKEAGIPLGELDPVGGVAGRDSYESLLLWNTEQLEKVLK